MRLACWGCRRRRTSDSGGAAVAAASMASTMSTMSSRGSSAPVRETIPMANNTRLSYVGDYRDYKDIVLNNFPIFFDLFDAKNAEMTQEHHFRK